MPCNTPKCSSQEKEPEKSKSEKDKKKIKIRATLFFDGTLNNQFNTKSRLDSTERYRKYTEAESSYENDYTNVSFLSTYLDDSRKNGYHHYFPIYIEGIGTVPQQEKKGGDKLLGYAFGEFATGVQAKVSTGLKNLIQYIEDNIGSKKKTIQIEEIRLDTFGFSRGAAAARHFVNIALNTTYIAAGGTLILVKNLKDKLIANGFDVKQVKVYFVGLFDTVSSVGFLGTKGEMSNVKELGLDAIKDAESVFHIASADEHRKNFAVTNIISAAKKGEEIILPGVHCDIGGSYTPNAKGIFRIYNTGTPYITKKKYKEIEDDLMRLVNDGWFLRSDIQHASEDRGLYAGEPFEDAVTWHGEVYVNRAGSKNEGISNRYSRIPLNLMKKKAESKSLSFTPEMNTNSDTSLSVSHNDPAEILQAKSEIEAFGKIGTSLLLLLRRDHFHFSADFDHTLGAYEPRYENGIRTRKIHNG